jgi:pimeloyl-ACP methyl ester carboxylesterase
MNLIVQGYPAYCYTGSRPFDPTLPAIVFIHGAAFDHSVWQWQSRYFAHHGFSVLAPDFPAHGKSPGEMRKRISSMADWIAALIESACIESAHIVGHSMGSLVALELAINHATRVNKLALVGTSIPMGVGDAFLAAARDDSPVGLDMEATWGHTRGSLLTQSPVPGMSLFGTSRQLNGRSLPGVLASDLGACAGYAPSMDAIRALKVPTLIAGGSLDQMTPMKAGQALAKEIPGAKFVALDAGHSMMSEAPQALVRALTSFLKVSSPRT